MSTIFQKIIAKEIPAKIAYEDEFCLAFHDVAPQAPLHVLVIPKIPLDRLSHATAEQGDLLGKLLLAAKTVAHDAGFADFRLVINDGAAAGQSVFHLHVHVLAGRPFAWPPG